MPFQALDSSLSLKDKISCLKSNGIAAVGRYYTSSKTNKKLLKPDEASALSQAGIRIWAVYQDRQDRLSDFTHARGVAAGGAALGYAPKTSKQPPGSATLFFVEFAPLEA